MPYSSRSGPSIDPLPQNTSNSGGSMNRLKRAFAGRRKNGSQEFDATSTLNAPVYDVAQIPRARSPRPGGGKFSNNVFTLKRALHSKSELSLDTPDLGSPPPPPPKESAREARLDPRRKQLDESGQIQNGEPEEREHWRKSNSTTHTVKPISISRSHKRKERDMSPNSSSSRSPSSVSSQLSSIDSSHTSMSAYPSNPSPPEKRTTKRSFTSGLIPDPLTGKRAAPLINNRPITSQEILQTSCHQTPSPPPTAWPQMSGGTEVLSRQLRLNEQQRNTTLSFMNANATLQQLGKKAVGKMNFKGWSTGITRSSSPGNQGNTGHVSNSSSSSLAPLEGPHIFPKGHFHPQAHTVSGQKGNRSVHSFASGSGSDVERPQPPPPSGPHLGVLLRAPLTRTGKGGLVFGRDLASATRETRVSPISLVEYNPAVQRNLEDRMVPALVLRCVMHLRKWGLDEEGIFRISGRQTHIQRLKHEFDSGADWDMSDCSPADLDPHAVASVLRAYLRALPDPILTRALGPQFEAVMVLEEASMERNSPTSGYSKRTGFALPLSPRAPPQIIRQPSVRDSIGAGVFCGPSEALVKSISQLISQLPPEHHDVLQTIAEIIRETARQSKFTKMPMSNLLLIFCPSLNMPPALLRLLCQCEEVWMPPPEVKKPRLARQRSASESVLLMSGSRKSSLVVGSQSSEHLPSSEMQTRSISALKSDTETESVEPPKGTVYSTGDSAPFTLPFPELSSVNQSASPQEEDEDYENPSRRHTIVATLPLPIEGGSLTLDPFDPPFSTSSLTTSYPPPLTFLDTGSSSSLEGREEGHGLPTCDDSEETRQHKLIVSMKELSDSEIRMQTARSTFSADSVEKGHPPLRHVVSLNLMSTKSKMLGVNSPPSAQSLPLENKSPLRQRVSSKLRLSFRRRSTLDMPGSDVTMDDTEERDKATSDTPPQLAPLNFDFLSLGPDDDEGATPSSIHLRAANRLSMHIRSHSTPLLKNSPLGPSEFTDGRNADRRTSITANHNLLLLPPLRNEPLSLAPKLDLEPSSQTGDDWLQSVLKAAAESAGGS